MKVYMAAFYNSRGGQTPHTISSKLSKPVNVLESYHYMTPPVIKEIRQDKPRKVFMDSGAFSMFTQGVQVDLKSYARFLVEHADFIEVASNLDVIGADNEAETYKRQKQMEDWGVMVKPVHHARDRDKWLERYLAEGYDYIFLGGMVPESTSYLREWLDHIWHNYLTNADGTPRVKVHGFGLTTLELMYRYPWYSVDSTSWVLTSNFGSVFLDMAHGTFKLDFSSKSSKQKEINGWHYNTLTPEQRQAVDARLAELEAQRIVHHPEVEARIEKAFGFKPGFNAQCLAHSYGWRDYMNVHYFERSQDRAVKTFKRTQETLFT